MIGIFVECFLTADTSARKSEVPPIVSASDRDLFAFDLGPSTFVSRTLSMPVSPPGLHRARLRAHARGINRRRRARRPELGGSCGDASVLFAAGEDLCGVVAPRRCFGPTRCRKNIYLWCLKYLWCLMVVDSSWLENVVRARVTAGCWSCVEIRTSTSTTADSYLIKSVPDFLRYLTASCWSWVENVVRATVTAGCWTCVGMGIFLIVG